MSTQLKGDIQINADPTRFVQGITRAEQSLNKLQQGTTKTGQSLRTLDQSTTKSSQSTQRLTQSTTQASQAMQRMGQSTQQAAAGAARMSQSAAQATQATSRMNVGMIGTAATIGGMGAGLVTAEASLSNYTKAAYKVEKAELKVEKTTLASQKAKTMLLNANNMLAKAEASGKKTREEILYYQEQVANYTEDYALKVDEEKLAKERLAIVNMDYADTQKTMASSLVMVTLNTVAMAAQMIQAKVAITANAAATKASTAANIANSKALKFLGIDLNAAKANFASASMAMKGFTINSTGARVAVTGFSKATQVASMTIKGLWASLGPIGILTILATSLYTAWETSQQFRDGVMWLIDGIQDLLAIVKQVIVPLQWLDEGLKAIGINVGESVDEWQEHNAVIGQAETQLYDADAAVKQLDTDVEDLTTDIQTEVQALDQAEIATVDLTGATQNLTTNVDMAATAFNAKTAAMQADHIMMQTASSYIQTEGVNALQSFRDSMNKASETARNHEQVMADNKLMVRTWANEYTRIMETEGPQAAAIFASETKSSLDGAISNIQKYGGDTGAVLAEHNVDWQSVGVTVSSVSTGVESDVSRMGGTVTRTMKSMHQEIAAFEAALKKNDNFVTYTTSDILRAFKTMSKEAQAEYERIKVQEAHAKSVIAGMRNSGITNIEGALTYNFATEGLAGQYGPGGANIGANIQHHGPSQRSTEANKLLSRGILVRDPVGDGMWRKSHSDSWKQSPQGKGKAVITREAIWTGSSWRVQDIQRSAAETLKAQVITKMNLAQSYYGQRKRQGTRRRLIEELAAMLKMSISEVEKLVSPRLTTSRGTILSADRRNRQLDTLQEQFWNSFDFSFGADARQQAELQTEASELSSNTQQQQSSHASPQQARDLLTPVKHASYHTQYMQTREDLGAGGEGGTAAHNIAVSYIRELMAGGKKDDAIRIMHNILADEYLDSEHTTPDMIQQVANLYAQYDPTGAKNMLSTIHDHESQRHADDLARAGLWKSEYEGHDVYQLRQIVELHAI